MLAAVTMAVRITNYNISSEKESACNKVTTHRVPSQYKYYWAYVKFRQENLHKNVGHVIRVRRQNLQNNHSLHDIFYPS